MPVEVDVLIIGGGAQGLWLLNDLDKREYKTVLLERRKLGGGQTCHSHALIHRGHYYDDIDMMITLNAAAQFWQAFIESRGIEQLNKDKAIAGFGPGTPVALHTYFWRTAGLRYKELAATPKILAGGRSSYLFETEEFSLDAQKVMEGLVQDVSHCIYKIDDSDQSIRFRVNHRKIETVTAIIDGESYELKPKMTVICAGENNLALLENVGAHLNPDNSGILVQARRKNHMLMLRGTNLPPLTAVFPIRGGLQGLFICSRVDPETGNIVWLASDHNSTPFNAGTRSSPEGDLDPRPSSSWVKRILVSLQAATPKLFEFAQEDSLDLAVYTGLTSERNLGSGKHMTDFFIDPLNLQNLLAIWPTKLTLTPLASNVAVRFIRPSILHPSGRWTPFERGLKEHRPAISVEMWRREPFTGETAAKTGWMRYSDFMAKLDKQEAALEEDLLFPPGRS